MAMIDILWVATNMRANTGFEHTEWNTVHMMTNFGNNCVHIKGLLMHKDAGTECMTLGTHMSPSLSKSLSNNWTMCKKISTKMEQRHPSKFGRTLVKYLLDLIEMLIIFLPRGEGIHQLLRLRIFIIITHSSCLIPPPPSPTDCCILAWRFPCHHLPQL